MCRKLIVSKHSLLPDPTFDLLISQIYSSRYEYNAYQTTMLKEQYKSRNQANVVQAINDGIQIQTQNLNPETNLQYTNIKNQEDEQNESGCSSTIKTPNNIESDKDVTKPVVQANVAQKPKAIVVSEEDCSVSTPIDESDTSEQDDTISGVTSDEIDRVVHEACIERECYPSPLNYYKYPKSCCTSINEVICHGIPDMRPLANGDICNGL